VFDKFASKEDMVCQTSNILSRLQSRSLSLSFNTVDVPINVDQTNV